MNVSRRDLAVAGAFAVGASGLFLSGLAGADAADEAAVAPSVQALRKALLESDKRKLGQVGSPHITYGHFDGKGETKEQIIKGGITPSGVPTGWPTLTTSRPGYLCWTSINCSVISSGGPTSHVPALIALRRVGSLA